MTALVIDVGTSGLRAIVVRADGTTDNEQHVEMLPSTPHPGLVEFDARTLADAALGLAERVLALAGPVTCVGVANQRASTIAWSARTGQPLAPGIGWQDLRTVGRCLELRAEGVRVAPNQSATKAEWLLQAADDDGHDRADVRLGTVDSWLAWCLTGGEHHVTDATNALVTGLYDVRSGGWDEGLLDLLGIPATALPDVVDTCGAIASTVLLGAPPLTALAGDQQASMVGQGCILPGLAKITFGTGGMLDLCLGDDPGPTPVQGTFPVIAWRDSKATVWGREAVMLSAGTSVEWLRDGIGLIDTAEQSEAMAASVPDSGEVVFVPSLSGTGTPDWDHGARGLLLGVTRGTSAAHVVRAVLEGVAQRGADMVEATEADTGQPVGALRVDGGMSRNRLFVQALADATGHTIEVSAEREATALGAGFLAGTAVGTWTDLTEAVSARPPALTVDPELDGHARAEARQRFVLARHRAGGWIPELSGLDL